MLGEVESHTEIKTEDIKYEHNFNTKQDSRRKEDLQKTIKSVSFVNS